MKNKIDDLLLALFPNWITKKYIERIRECIVNTFSDNRFYGADLEDKMRSLFSGDLFEQTKVSQKKLEQLLAHPLLSKKYKNSISYLLESCRQLYLELQEDSEHASAIATTRNVVRVFRKNLGPSHNSFIRLKEELHVS